MSSFLVVAGCYEKSVFGWAVVDNQTQTNNKKKQQTSSSSAISLQPLFVNVAHDQSIRTVGAIDRYFVTGSADQTIK